LGFGHVASGSYDVAYYVRDVDSFLFWLQSVPLPEPFDIEKHGALVQTLIRDNQTPRGIRSNEHRELIVVRKSEPN
jgi:hypothetical protein